MVSHVITCPSCKRNVFTRRDIMYAPLEGRVQCRFCGRAARLDLLGRWIILAVLALMLPGLLLYGGVFYSGHLFVVSIFIILIAWALLALLCFPLLTLEAVDGRSLDRAQGTMMLIVILVAAMLLDVFIASRFESEEKLEKNGHATVRRSS